MKVLSVAVKVEIKKNQQPLKIMIPKIQTRLHRGSEPKERGNCYPAVIASILEIEVEDVIQFQELYDELWYEPIVDWLYERGYELADGDDFKCFHNSRLALDRFFLTEGKNPDGLPFEQWREIMCDNLEGQYYFVSGISPRNKDINHITIYRDGKIIHDPHPDNTGILSEERFEQLIKIT